MLCASWHAGEAKAEAEKILFVETSAKSGLNVKSLFRKLASALPGVEGTLPQPSGLVDIKLTANPNDDRADAAKCAC